MTAPIPGPIDPAALAELAELARDPAAPDWLRHGVAIAELAHLARIQGAIDADGPDCDYDPWG